MPFNALQVRIFRPGCLGSSGVGVSPAEWKGFVGELYRGQESRGGSEWLGDVLNRLSAMCGVVKAREERSAGTELAILLEDAEEIYGAPSHPPR